MATAEAETDVQVTPEQPEAEAERPRQELFKWNAWVHVGDGAEECEARFTGKCKDDKHFHAWVRLPNPYQVRDIHEKASAAKARRRTTLRNADSDARAILEDELEEIRESGAKEIVVDELIDAEFQSDYVRAVREVEDMDDPEAEQEEGEDDEPPKLYRHIDQDREEYQRQLALPEDQRSEDFDTLAGRVSGYSTAINEQMNAIQQPRRDTLMEKEWDELIDMVRKNRIEDQCGEAFLHTFNTWQCYVCTYRPIDKGTPKDRLFTDINDLKFNQPPEVIEALQTAFGDLEQRLARSRQSGKS